MAVVAGDSVEMRVVLALEDVATGTDNAAEVVLMGRGGTRLQATGKSGRKRKAQNGEQGPQSHCHSGATGVRSRQTPVSNCIVSARL